MIGDIGGRKPCLSVKNCNLELQYLHMHGCRAKLNVKTQEEPMEDEEAFVSFSVAPLSYLFPVPLCFFAVYLLS